MAARAAAILKHHQDQLRHLRDVIAPTEFTVRMIAERMPWAKPWENLGVLDQYLALSETLAHLNFHLNSVPGVVDGAFWLPADELDGAVTRLVAFVVAPGLTPAALQQAVLAHLRPRVDAVFLPRRTVAVPALPREPSTGKLPAIAFGEWARRQLAP